MEEFIAATKPAVAQSAKCLVNAQNITQITPNIDDNGVNYDALTKWRFGDQERP